MRIIELKGMTVRLVNSLESNGIKYVEDLIKISKSELLKYPGLGGKSVNCIMAILKQNGYELMSRMDEERNHLLSDEVYSFINALEEKTYENETEYLNLVLYLRGYVMRTKAALNNRPYIYDAEENGRARGAKPYRYRKFQVAS